MTDLVTLAALALVLFLSGRHIYNAKKRGEKCVGCPYAKDCASHGNCASGQEHQP